jgi:electron transfer flavoprotein alpha subunit
VRGCDGSESAAAAAGLGAVRVLLAEIADGHGGVASVDALAAAAMLVNPGAILIPHTVDGRDLAAPRAVRTRSAIAANAVRVSRDDEGSSPTTRCGVVWDSISRLNKWVSERCQMRANVYKLRPKLRPLGARRTDTLSSS